MKWLIFLLSMGPLLATAASQKNLKITYVVTSNDVAFYNNQPIYFKISVCDKNVQLCTDLSKSDTYTFTGTQKALQMALHTEISNSTLLSIIRKRRIHPEDTNIKMQMVYGRNDIFQRFVQTVIRHKDLIPRGKELSIALKDYHNSQSGIVEFSYLKVKQ